MKKSRFTEETDCLCPKASRAGHLYRMSAVGRPFSDATFSTWHQKYGGISPSELKHMRQLEEENLRPKNLVADLSLDKDLTN